MQEIIFENHPLLLIGCLCLGLIYAFVLYQKHGTWGVLTNRLLFLIRTLAVFFIAMLLVSPILRQLVNTTEKPVFVFAIDDSQSMAAVRDSAYLSGVTGRLREMSVAMKTAGFEIDYRRLNSDGGEEPIRFEGEFTDISALLGDIQRDYENKNLAGMVLVSDGIYNRGISPAFPDYGFEINTLSIGDSVPKSDIVISNLFFNRLSYQGNKFPLVVQLKQQGYDGEQVVVSVSGNGRKVSSKQVALPLAGSLKTTEFLIEAKESGFQRYVVSVTKKEGELTYDNNVKSAYVEVIAGREKIALIAASPHPDIKALRSAIESNSNYAFESYILSIGKDVKRLDKAAKDFDLVIYHQLHSQSATIQKQVSQFKKGSSRWYIIGSRTGMPAFNKENPLINIRPNRSEYDKVGATFNDAFGKFDLSDDLKRSFGDFPPLAVPFGKYSLKGGTSAMLFQRVGSITTSRPLLCVKESKGDKSAVMMGTGLWKWKLADYANHRNNDRFNELVTKLVQYLSTKDDKRKFRVYPLKNEYFYTEKAVFEAEIYNDLYEEIYDVAVSLTLTDQQNKTYDYKYVTGEGNTQFEISGLPEGVYRYRASATLGGKPKAVNGQLVIKDIKLETADLTADPELLGKLAKNTGGRFFGEDEIDRLASFLTDKKAVGTIYSHEKLLPLINLSWVLILILSLVSAEWFTRKYYGSY